MLIVCSSQPSFFFFFLIPPSAFVFSFCHFPVRLVRRQFLAAAAMLPSPPCPLPWQRKHSSEQSNWFMISYMSSSSALTSPGKELLIRLNGLKMKSTVDWHPWSVPPSSRNSAIPEHLGISCEKAEWTNNKETNGTWNNSKYSWCYTPAASSVHLDLETHLVQRQKEPVGYQRITRYFWTRLDERTARKFSSLLCTRHCTHAIFCFFVCLFEACKPAI